MHLVGSSREAHRDDRHARQERILLPRLERDRGQEIVVAEHDVRSLTMSHIDGVGDPNDTLGVDAELCEKLPEMIAEIAMPSDAQCLQWPDSLDW